MSEPMTRRERTARAIRKEIDDRGPFGWNVIDISNAAIEALRPDAEAFTVALDALIESVNDWDIACEGSEKTAMERSERAYDAARREVERLAGIGEGE